MSNSRWECKECGKEFNRKTAGSKVVGSLGGMFPISVLVCPYCKKHYGQDDCIGKYIGEIEEGGR